MPLTKIQLQPGIHRENPSLSSEGFWYDCDKVRFKQGKPEKIGGWVGFANSPEILGVPRTSYSWRSNSGVRWQAIGTHSKLYVLTDETLSDVTPIRETQALEDPFDTTNDNTTIVVNDVSHGSDTGDYVTFTGATHANFTNNEVNANHEITKIDDDSYTITVTTACAGTASDIGGSVTATYEISIGNVTSTPAFGFGAAGWGVENWGDARSTTGVIIGSRIWSLDNFGEDLIATHEGGGMYRWDSSVGTGTRAAIISNAPTESQLAVVTTPDRHLVSLGSHDGSGQDLMLIQWADQESLTDWTPTATNTAGSQVISGAGQIIAVQRSQGQVLIWTDVGLHGMQYIGPPYTFGFKELGQNCGAVGPNSIISVHSVNYWMSDGGFFIYDGAIRPLQCSVHSFVFDNIDANALDRVVAGANHKFNEVIWFYADTTSPVNNRYVIFNYAENLWYYGALERTAWDSSSIYDNPRGLDSSGNMYEHESGTDDDGSAMTAYIETAEFDVGDGDSMVLVKKIVPDFDITGDVNMIIRSKRYPHAQAVNETSQSISSTTEKLDVRLRGRSASIYISSNAVGDDFRLGDIRLDMRPDGKR